MTIHAQHRNKKIDLIGNICDDAPDFQDSFHNDIWDDVTISIEGNEGGYIQGVLDYIKEIRSTENTKFTVSAKGLIASSAAVLYFYLLLHQNENKLRNVTIVAPENEFTVVFHRLRDFDTNCVVDAGECIYNVDHPMNDAQASKFVDDVFEKTLMFLEYIGRKISCEELGILANLDKTRASYNLGEDITFSYKKEYAEIVGGYLSLREKQD